MFNSCVNPLIYWVTNGEYQEELFELLKFANVKRYKRRNYKLEYQMYSLGTFYIYSKSTKPN